MDLTVYGRGPDHARLVFALAFCDFADTHYWDELYQIN